MDFLVITGLSGAGKTIVHDALEDIGYYCVDNIPQTLLMNFYELCAQAQEIKKAAVVIDCRSFGLFSDFYDSLANLRGKTDNVKLLYIDCDEDTLLRRYKENRRTHPLAQSNSGSTVAAIEAEKRMLEQAKKQADFKIDTSDLKPANLKERVKQLFGENGTGTMRIDVFSFGFKHGLPREADLQFDVRCFPNPYYVDELRELTGLDERVRDYVINNDETQGFLTKLCDMAEYLVPLYIKEGKSQLLIGVGCTGGRHRSVAIAEALASFLRSKGHSVAVTHRDKDLK